MSKRLFSQVVEKEENDTKAAIPLSKTKPDLINGIPYSGEDYLLTVRQQAKEYRQTIVAPPPKETKKVQLPAHFQFSNNSSSVDDQASETWRKGFASLFRSHQQSKQNNKDKSQNLKEIRSKNDAYKLLYSHTEQTIQLIPTFSQHTILRILEYHIQWLASIKEEDVEAKCQRIFILLAYLDPVMTSNNVSILRDLSRECIRVRTKYASQKSSLNIIITIIADIFGQTDLL
ncbi:MAG: survival motor neuron interacting protein 1-domain-containing protein [Benjaminiella poitrasii]|nr:MAG: survival motor neuron interacting protein 1-domain-containing protein [Benjaminiella poitrasii]